jgi:hypothetical protein
VGADAVIVTRDFLVPTRGGDHELVAGTAIKFRQAGDVPQPRGS